MTGHRGSRSRGAPSDPIGNCRQCRQPAGIAKEGGNGGVHFRWIVYCASCGHMTAKHAKKREAVKAWNGPTLAEAHDDAQERMRDG